ncbi:MAG: hypothetical protein GY859_02990 [Desulfobacterales bacterium]|nr:hypothetical protein [Desulfobacterales bacterium]
MERGFADGRGPSRGAGARLAGGPGAQTRRARAVGCGSGLDGWRSDGGADPGLTAAARDGTAPDGVTTFMRGPGFP